MAIFYRIVADIDSEYLGAARSIEADKIFNVFAGCGDLCRLRHVPIHNVDTGEDFAVHQPCNSCSYPCEDRHVNAPSKIVLGEGAPEEDRFWVILASTPCERIVAHVRNVRPYLLIIFSPEYAGEDIILPAETGIFGLRRILKDAKDAVSAAYRANATPGQLLEICNKSLRQGFEREINNAQQANLPLLVHFMQMWKARVKCYAA